MQLMSPFIFSFLIPLFLCSSDLRFSDTFQSDVYIYSEESFDNNIQLVLPGSYICNSSIISPFTKKVVAFCLTTPPKNRKNSTQLNSTYFQFYKGGVFELEYTFIDNGNNESQLPITTFKTALNSTYFLPSFDYKFSSQNTDVWDARRNFSKMVFEFKSPCKFIIESWNITNAFFILNSVKVYESDYRDYLSDYIFLFSYQTNKKENDGLIDLSDSRDYLCNNTFVCPNLFDFNMEFTVFCSVPNLTYGKRYWNLPPKGFFEIEYTYCDKQSNDFPSTYMDVIMDFFGYELEFEKIELFDGPKFPVDLSINKRWTWKKLLFRYSFFGSSNKIFIYSNHKIYDNNLILTLPKFYANKTDNLNNPHCSAAKSPTNNSWYSQLPVCQTFKSTSTPCIENTGFLFSGYDSAYNKQKKQIFVPLMSPPQIIENFVCPSNCFVEYTGKEAKESDIYIFDSYEETYSKFGLTVGFPIPFSKGQLTGEYEYQQTMKKLVNEHKSRTITSYEKEEIELQLDPLYQLTSEFKLDMLNLPKNISFEGRNMSLLQMNSDYLDYQSFVEKYGNHFVTKVVLGGKLKIFSEVHRCEIQNYDSKSHFLKGFVKKVSDLKVQGGISLNTTRNDSFYMEKKFKIEVQGGITSMFCCDKCNVKKWSDTVRRNMEIISFQVENITMLIDDPVVRRNMEIYIDFYMSTVDAKENAFNASSIDDFACYLGKLGVWSLLLIALIVLMIVF